VCKRKTPLDTWHEWHDNVLMALIDRIAEKYNAKVLCMDYEENFRRIRVTFDDYYVPDKATLINLKDELEHELQKCLDHPYYHKVKVWLDLECVIDIKPGDYYAEKPRRKEASK